MKEITKNGITDSLLHRQRAFIPLISCSILLFILSVIAAGCKHDHMPSLSTGGHDYLEINLVADTAGFSAQRVDVNLGNPWGIAVSAKGSFWISCNHTGQTVIYDGSGTQTLAPVAIPLNGLINGSSPDGVVYNTGDSTVKVADRSSANAVYKGITIANDGTGNFLYVADFFNGRIDVFDHAFKYVSNKSFSDPGIPAGFAPFNIRNIGGKLFVAYAKQQGPDNHDDQSGSGNGYIDIFNPDGTFVKRFASQGALNSPWGIIQPPVQFGQGANVILVANFGDGRINVFDTSGTLSGPLENNGIPITINGLWDIAFSPLSNTQLYFTAGPEQETHGLFGYLTGK